jgi:hypothetical protein
LAENAILKECQNKKIQEWDSPSVYIDNIYNHIIKVLNSANPSNSKSEISIYEQLAEYKNTSITVLQFALCEYDIYSEFNQIIISLASCLISLKEDNNINNIVNTNNINKIIIDIIKNLEIDFSLIENCINKILNMLNTQEYNSDENTSEDDNPKFQFQNESMICFAKTVEKEINSWEIKE